MQETIENIKIKSGKCGFIHSVTVHQGDELFSVEQSRGKQCAFMSISAVLTANPLIDWSPTTFSNVLFLTCNQSRGTNVAGAHNRIDKIFICASPPTWLTCKSRITFILQGDKMYLKALNSGLVLDQGVEFLSVDNLPNVVGVSCCTSMFSYAIHDSSLIDKFHNLLHSF